MCYGKICTTEQFSKTLLILGGSSTSLSGGSAASRKTSGSQQPPPLPPPPAPEILHHFPSPFQQPRNFHHAVTNNGRLMHSGAISDARLYNRSLMSQAGIMNNSVEGNLPPQGHPPNLPPLPPARGVSSYNGVRAGSFASFGHPSQQYAVDGNGFAVVSIFDLGVSGLKACLDYLYHCARSCNLNFCFLIPTELFH